MLFGLEISLCLGTNAATAHLLGPIEWHLLTHAKDEETLLSLKFDGAPRKPWLYLKQPECNDEFVIKFRTTFGRGHFFSCSGSTTGRWIRRRRAWPWCG